MKEEHCKELGIYLVTFQDLEKTISFFLIELAGIEQNLGNILISKYSFKNLCAVFGVLFNYRCASKDIVKRMQTILSRIGILEEKRNSIVHSNWGTPAVNYGDGAMRLKTKIKKNEIVYDIEILDKTAFQKITKDVTKEMNNFLDLMKEVKDKGIIKFSNLVKM